VLLRILILIAALAAPLAGYAQVALGIGQSPAEFAADSDATLKIASWAFSIWGLIYLGLLVYAVYQLRATSCFLSRMALPSLVALAGITAWIFAAAWDAEWATIVLICGSALALLTGFWSAAPDLAAAPARERWLAVWPLGLLAGWLTFASAGNVLTILTGNGQLPDALPPTGWAVAAIAVVAGVVVLMLRRTRLPALAIPPAWGLVGATAAEWTRNPSLAWLAAGFALLLLAAAFVLRSRGR